MKIDVISHYDTFKKVNICDLKRLIASGEVSSFRRAAGWVKVGVDPVRGQGGKEYDGPERRNIVQKPLTEEQRRGAHYCVIGISGPDTE